MVPELGKRGVKLGKAHPVYHQAPSLDAPVQEPLQPFRCPLAVARQRVGVDLQRRDIRASESTFAWEM